MLNFINQIPLIQTGKRIAIRVQRKTYPFIYQGHPWLFESSISKISRTDGQAGDVAVIFDESGKKVLGAGLYDPNSPVRVKLLAHSADSLAIGFDLFNDLATKAFELRQGKLSKNTNAWRLIHGESDGFPGIIADKYAQSLVIKIYSAVWVPYLKDIISILFNQHPTLNRCVIRLSRELQKLNLPIKDGMLLGDNSWDGHEIFSENGIQFKADLQKGQKTGFFLDQRDNRSRVGDFSNGKDVLNLFSYSGGFSLYAARAGAKTVCSVDFNKHAINDCELNFKLNEDIENIKKCKHIGIAGDAFEVMNKLLEEKKLFDVVVVDPPSFAKSSSEKSSALNSYARLARSAVKLLKRGGILVFASCSSRVTSDELFPLVLENAKNVGRKLKVLSTTAHAVDHPAKFKESNYLKSLFAKSE